MSKYNKRIYVPSSRKKANEAFSKAFINRIVQAVEGGLSRKELCHMHGMSSTTLAEWMSRYGSIRYHQNKKKSFSETERNVTARAVLEGRVSIKEAALSKGVRRTTIQQWIRQKQAQEADLSVVNLEVMPLKNTLAANVLADELSQAILKIKALETLIDIAEQQFKIAIRKKSGAKQ